MAWTDRAAALADLSPADRAELDRLVPKTLPSGAVLFRPGDSVQGYAIVLSGRIDVCLTGPSGRDILLYAVAPGQSCVQSTLGLLGGDDYSAEARTVEPTELVLLPRTGFLGLLDRSAPFRKVIFAAFAERMQSMMHLLEKLAFLRVEARLAQALLDRADPLGRVTATQAELATAIGSAREVVSRRLVALARTGAVTVERGVVTIRDPEQLVARTEVGET